MYGHRAWKLGTRSKCRTNLAIAQKYRNITKNTVLFPLSYRLNHYIDRPCRCTLSSSFWSLPVWKVRKVVVVLLLDFRQIYTLVLFSESCRWLAFDLMREILFIVPASSKSKFSFLVIGGDSSGDDVFVFIKAYIIWREPSRGAVMTWWCETLNSPWCQDSL